MAWQNIIGLPWFDPEMVEGALNNGDSKSQWRADRTQLQVTVVDTERGPGLLLETNENSDADDWQGVILRNLPAALNNVPIRFRRIPLDDWSGGDWVHPTSLAGMASAAIEEPFFGWGFGFRDSVDPNVFHTTSVASSDPFGGISLDVNQIGGQDYITDVIPDDPEAPIGVFANEPGDCLMMFYSVPEQF